MRKMQWLKAYLLLVVAGLCAVFYTGWLYGPLPEVVAQFVQTSINGAPPPYTFTGSGVSQTGQTFTFSGGATFPTAASPGQIIASTAAGTTYAALGQIFYAQSGDTISSIESECSSACTYHVTVPQTITLSASHTLNPLVELVFDAGGKWTINGTGFKMTFIPGQVQAAWNQQIFAGAGITSTASNVAGLSPVYPEWLGTLAPGGIVTVATAIASLTSNGGDVYLNGGASDGNGFLGYRSGQEKTSATDYSAINWVTTPNVRLHGYNNPAYNNLTAPTQMSGGAIIWGGFYAGQGSDGFSTDGIGYDTGSYIKTTYFNTFTALDSLLITSALPGNATFFPRLQRIRVLNGKCLGYNNSSSDHCTLVENVEGAEVRHWQTVFHSDGLVLKGINSTLDDIYSRGHNFATTFVKSDTYAPTYNDTLSNIHATYLASVGDTAGAMFQGGTAVLKDVTMTNFTMWGIAVSTGAVQCSGSANNVSQLTISNGTVDGSTTTQGASGGGFVGISTTTNCSSVFISNVKVVNESTGINAAAGGGDITVTGCGFGNNGTAAIVNGTVNMEISASKFGTFESAGSVTSTNGITSTGAGAVTFVYGANWYTAPSGNKYNAVSSGVFYVDGIGQTPVTVSGCGTAGSITGNGQTGSFTVGTGATNCTFTITINGATGTTASHGWNGNVDDTTAGIHCVNSATVSATTLVTVCTGVVATGDIIKFSAAPY